jgi:hypothetical protein
VVCWVHIQQHCEAAGQGRKEAHTADGELPHIVKWELCTFLFAINVAAGIGRALLVSFSRAAGPALLAHWLCRKITVLVTAACCILQVLLSCYECLLDVSKAGVMLTAALLLTAYCARFPAATQLKASYSIYDSANQNPARIFMPAKIYSQPALDAAVAAWKGAAGNSSSADASSLLDNGQQPLQPGVAGRWLLPDADGDFDALAGLMAGVGSMAQLWVSYSLLQGIVLILLALR